MQHPAWYDNFIKQEVLSLFLNPLTIVPVSLQPTKSDQTPANPSKTSGHCQIKIGSAEVTLQNSVDERIIQVNIRELMNQ